jgi:hypothetical protein
MKPPFNLKLVYNYLPDNFSHRTISGIAGHRLRRVLEALMRSGEQFGADCKEHRFSIYITSVRVRNGSERNRKAKVT